MKQGEINYKYECEKLKNMIKQLQEDHRIELDLMNISHRKEIDYLKIKFDIIRATLDEVLNY